MLHPLWCSLACCYSNDRHSRFWAVKKYTNTLFFFFFSLKIHQSPFPNVPFDGWTFTSRKPNVTEKNKRSSFWIQPFFLVKWSIWIIRTRLEKKAWSFSFLSVFLRRWVERLTNQKGSVFVGNWICAYPYSLPNSRNVLKLIESASMITGRCGKWCTKHLRNGPACVISLSYGSIKHFIIKHYSKQTVSLKGRGEKYNTSECMCYPLDHQIPITHSYCSS